MVPVHSPKTHMQIDKYKDAVWAFIVEHCDVTESGKLFVKFHMDNRKNFENRVWARYKYEYHREDWQAKDKWKEEVHVQNILHKKEKRKAFLTQRKERHARYDLERRITEWSLWYTNMQGGGIFRRIKGYILSKTWKKKPHI